MHKKLTGASLGVLLIAFAYPAQAYDKAVCIDNPSTGTMTIPTDFGQPSIAITESGGGGAGASTPTNGQGSGGGGGAIAAFGNFAFTPSATVAIGVGAGGLGGVLTVNSGIGGNGGQSFICKTSSCPLGYKDTNALVGVMGALGGQNNVSFNGAQCTGAPFGGPGGYCFGGGDAGGSFGNNGAGGGAGAGGPSWSGGSGGLGFLTHPIGPYGGGGGGAAGPGAPSNGGNAVGAVGGPGGTPAAGGGCGGNGGTSSATTYGQHGCDGTLWQTLAPLCFGPAGGAGAPSADNVTTDPLSPTGNPDGGRYGGGGAPGDPTGAQKAGAGGKGAVLLLYTSTIPPLAGRSQAGIF